MRLILVGLCAAAIGLAGLDLRHTIAGRERALERIERHGLDERFPDLGAEVRRRYDPVDAELRVAQALLNLELDRSWMAELDPDRARREIERGTERLAEAAAIAGAARPRRPAAWQAPMVLGGATYLRLYRERDPRLTSEPGLWEQPLLAAQRLAPAKPEPLRFLSAAYLGNWSSLGDDRRAAATRLLARTFQDRDSYRLLIRDWLRVAPSRDRALALVPEQPWAWQILQQLFSEAGDWELFVNARRRWYGVLGRDLDRTLDEISAQLEGGERRRARGRLLLLLQQVPRSLDFASRLQRVLELLPPGPASSPTAELFAEWLDWAFDLCLLGECPFEPPVLSRLARLATEAPPDRQALAHVLAGDLPRAELLERRFAQPQDSGWSRFYLLKAEHLAALGRGAAARESLDQLPRAWRDEPRYWLAARAVARAQDDPDSVARADAELASLRRSRWHAQAWVPGAGEQRLTLLPSAEASGLHIDIERAGRGGAVVELFWDGRMLAIERATRSSTTLELELPVTPEPHGLAVRFVAGSARLGAVELSGSG